MLALRTIALDAGLTETWKWKQPCYVFEKHNVVIIGTLQEGAVMGFFKGALLKDPEGILAPSGPNTRAARDIRFASLDEINSVRETLGAYLQEAIEIEKAGLAVDFSDRDDVPMPEELQERLDGDSRLREAFEALTPGRQRAYRLVIGDAKQAKTRSERVDKYVPKIMDGIGPNEW